MTNTKLTAKETALMTQIAKRQFSFFDEGLVAGSGIWSDALTGEAGAAVSASARGAATVMSSLCRKGLLYSDQGAYLAEADEDGAWVELTEAGAAWCAEFNGETEEAAEAEVVETAAPVEEVQAGEFTWGTSEWTTDGAEWTEWRFEDGSRAVRRRRQVSGAWRTDFWGAEFFGDKERATTSAKVKAARAAGTFTH